MGLPFSALEFEIVATLQGIEQGLRVKVVTHRHLPAGCVTSGDVLIHVMGSGVVCDRGGEPT